MTDNIFIDLNKLQFLGEIGEGGFGEVIKVKNKDNGEIYAAKISKIKMDEKIREELISLLREVNFLSSIDHPAIVKFIGFSSRDFDDDSHPVIVTEFISNGSLRNIIDAESKSNAPKEWDNTKKLINLYGIAAAMLYLHDHHVIHRDLKPENILEDDFLFPKIADFGLSKKTHSNEYSMTYNSQFSEKGTLAYIAPEVRENQDYTSACDVYAYSYIMYEVITNQTPFEGNKYDVQMRILNNNRPSFPPDTPNCYRELIEKCWDIKPEKRPDFQSICNTLTNDQRFRNEIEQDQFNEYVEMINSATISYKSNKPFNISEIIEQSQKDKRMTFNKIIFNIQDETERLERERRKISEIEDEREAQTFLEKLSKNKDLNNLPEETIKFLTTQLHQSHSKLKQLDLYHKEVEMLFNNGSLESKDFQYILKYFNTINIFLNYPTTNFDEIIKCIVKIKKKNEDVNTTISMSNSRELNNELANNPVINIALIEQPMVTIGNEAFRNCSSLVEVKIPYSTNTIGDFAFSDCTSLTNIFIPTTISKIGSHAFNNCSSLANVSIPQSVYAISDYLFCGCTSLSEFSIPQYVTSIGAYSFSECSSLVELMIPPLVTAIGDHAFSECVALSKMVIPEKVTKIGRFIFAGCTALSEVKIPSSIHQIEEGTFSGCSALVTVSIPSVVIKIGEHAFEGCTLLQEIEIPSSVTVIESHCFSKCKSLVDIHIPQSITEIRSYAFNECVKLSKLIIPSSVRSIGSHFLYGCSSISEISIPTSITEIEEHSFDCCSNLEHIVIPSSVRKIGEFAFSECSSLIEISIPDSIQKIEGFTFNECYELKEISIPNSVNEIGKYAFVECTSLTNVVIPSSVKIIGEYAFSGCSSIVSIVIPDSVTVINDWSFFNCKSLKSIQLPNNLSSIGNSSFSKCISLTEIELPASVSKIGKFAFSGCSQLAEIELPPNLNVIEKSVCSGCKALMKVNIPSSVTKIKKLAFRGCSSLQEIFVPFSVTEINEKPFADCFSLNKISIPSILNKMSVYRSLGVDKKVKIQFI